VSIVNSPSGKGSEKKFPHIPDMAMLERSTVDLACVTLTVAGQGPNWTKKFGIVRSAVPL
jgi:hypothetical protein